MVDSLRNDATQPSSIVPFSPRPPSYPAAKAGATVLAALLALGAGAAEAADDDQPQGEARQEAASDAAERGRRGGRRAETVPVEAPPEFRGPDVTLIAGEERTIYEYRQNGQLRMIKVVPKIGRPYYLAPRDRTRGWGDLEQAEALLPEWVLIEF